VPAGVGIDPAVGYAPLHTYDPSGIHVESPTVRIYTLGELFGVWGVRLTPAALPDPVRLPVPTRPVAGAAQRWGSRRVLMAGGRAGRPGQ
jgi:hypothetical protein